MVYLFFAWVAGAGLAASVACHLLAWLHIVPPWGKSVFVLHVGIFVLWIPLVVMANRTMPEGRRGNLDHLIAVLPRWVRGATTLLFLYAMGNFGWFLFCAGKYPKHHVPFDLELRGVSGHWMLFYGIATIGYAGLSRLARKRMGEGAEG